MRLLRMTLRTVHGVAILSAVVYGGPVQAAVIEAYWDFDQVGGATATDGSGNSRDATLNGNAAITAGGQFGGALSLDGTTGTNAEAVGYKGITGTAARTVSVWVNPSSASPADGAIVGWGDNSEASSNGRAWRVRLQSLSATDGALRAEFNNAGIKDSVATDLFDGQYHFLTVTMPAGGNRNDHLLYIDGVPVATTVDGSANNVAINTNTLRDVLIGERPVASGALNEYAGLIDDLAIFSQQLTNAEVAAFYNLGVEDDLQYDAGDANSVISVNGGGSILIDGVLWQFAPGVNSGGTFGQVVDQNGQFLLQLDNGGTIFGVVVPEPATLSIWLLLGMVAAFGWWKSRRN